MDRQDWKEIGAITVELSGSSCQTPQKSALQEVIELDEPLLTLAIASAVAVAFDELWFKQGNVWGRRQAKLLS